MTDVICFCCCRRFCCTHIWLCHDGKIAKGAKASVSPPSSFISPFNRIWLIKLLFFKQKNFTNGLLTNKNGRQFDCDFTLWKVKVLPIDHLALDTFGSKVIWRKIQSGRASASKKGKKWPIRFFVKLGEKSRKNVISSWLNLMKSSRQTNRLDEINLCNFYWMRKMHLIFVIKDTEVSEKSKISHYV